MASWYLGRTSLEDGENVNRAKKEAHKARLCPSVYQVTFGYNEATLLHFPSLQYSSKEKV